MKKLFSFAIACMAAATMVAQSSLMATLSHDGKIKTFYGITAYKEALAAAENGDAITLSAGQFTAGNINKAVSIHGAGMSYINDSINTQEQTIIDGDFIITQKDSTDKRLSIEGLYFKSEIKYFGNIQNAMFLKTRFYGLSQSNSDSKLLNATFIHCRISQYFYLRNNSSALFVNSILRWPGIGLSSDYSSCEYDNCVIVTPEFDICHHSYFKNCILVATTSNGYVELPSSCVAYHCIGICISGYRIFDKITTGSSIWSFTDFSIFKNFSCSLGTDNLIGFNDKSNFELTDEAKTKYLGTDGTQVGIYGGNLPYDELVTSPKITKCNVASKSTADGKLSVDIEVKGADY